MKETKGEERQSERGPRDGDRDDADRPGGRGALRAPGGGAEPGQGRSRLFRIGKGRDMIKWDRDPLMRQ